MIRPLLLAAAVAACNTLAAHAQTATTQPVPPARLTLNFNDDWRFFKGEAPPPPATQPALVGGNYAPIDPASHAYSDSGWRKLSVPHDWSIEGPFDQNAPTQAAGAYAPSGIGWYRKTFSAPADSKGKKVFLEFDAIMANSDVWLNKIHLGHRPNGYVPQRFDITDALDYAGPNVLAVRTDTSRQPASRWYSGAGIYRNTRLLVQNPVHIEAGSTFITTPSITADAATVRIRTTVVNNSSTERNITLSVMVYGLVGEDVVPAKLPPKLIPAAGSVTFEHDWPLRSPALWSPQNPFLYTASVDIHDGDQLLDNEQVAVGIRTAEFKPDTGFHLNGKNIKLKGVCLHHDAGMLGAAVPASIWEYRLKELKKYGVNAIRCAHAPMAPEFYALCDKLGLLVMDEAFDVWTVGKMPADYHLHFKDWWQRDLEAIINAHRNHPSIVMWSLGNEIWDILPQNPDPALDQFTGPNRSIDVARNLFLPMRDLAHQLDPTRPVTLAVMRPNVNNTYTNGFADLTDVIGQNYRDGELAAAHKQNPARKIIGTENYKTRESWLALRDNPALAGQFLWAGIDYLGEAGRWPNVVSPSGILDKTGFPKGDALERAAWWSDQPVVYITRLEQGAVRPGQRPVIRGFADWSPANTNPHDETVAVYSNADSVELFLNDQSLGSKPKDAKDAQREWKVPFAPGTLKAVAKTNNAVVAKDELKTATAPAKLLLTADRTSLKNDFDDALLIRAIIADASGTRIPASTTPITFTLEGPAQLLATDSGALADHAPPTANPRSAFQGTTVAILRATADTGTITLKASAKGLTPATLTLEAKPAP